MSTESTEPVEPEEPAPAAPPPAPPPAKKNWLKFVIVGVLAIALIGGAIYLFNQFGSGPANAKVGDCASIKPKDQDQWDVTLLKCADANATHKVAKVLPNKEDACPEDGYYEPVGVDKKQLCLMPNFEEGACYTPSDDGSTFKKGECKGDSVVKVVKKIDGNPDPVDCPSGSSDLKFSEPAVIFCLGTGETP
ncbi:hypothetical protein Lesp02_49380 [Lentzea sp. NBRC 105346]|uniref:LppU/SCO3897 family protein n=1 Tax=Lentzea sp. NBRC 105346 TaxID=3032205 RepID=UPI0024A2693E|nr:hypothetical protein [Lentzea sp. NBRC 105346]GLZ32750.1 hypothetical protein Lesp02_49380 [Lentzea sp. NBRC 105346]